MLIIMQSGCALDDLERVRHVAEGLGYETHTVTLGVLQAVSVVGYSVPPNPAIFQALPMVTDVRRGRRPLPLVDRAAQPERTTIEVGNVTIGGANPVVIAGPCAVENEDELLDLAARLRSGGAHILRGGAWKPRTSPYDFQGLGEDALRMLARARSETRMPVITEAVDQASLDLVVEYADIVQIGARNMQNYSLLKSAGRCPRPVFLKRGMAASMEEWLFAAEYILAEGNPNVILCERGIRTFSDHSRFTLDLSVVPQIRKQTHLPIFVDPSHASGDRTCVPPLARAAMAVGADGIMVEVHVAPERALSDGAQSLPIEDFADLAQSLVETKRASTTPRETLT